MMKGKICMITGANSGIGKATALSLAKLGANLVLVCRNRERAEQAIVKIKEKTGNQSIDLIIADLSSQKQIRNLVSEFKEKYDKLHVLINNAGVNLNKHTLTEDGIEATFAVNYLAYFMLCNLLLGTLKNTGSARIVNVASSVQAKSIDFDDLNENQNYRQLKAYAQSKLAVVLFTYEFARKIKGTGVSVNCLHPGYVKTKMIRNFRPFVKYFYHLIGLFILTPKRGAKTSIFLASSPDIDGTSGKYFKRRKEAKSVKISYDETVAKQLWDVSVSLTNVDLKN
ncbi:MAG: SDR family oxidoreductase [Promethearchaeota archaeon]|nr:MAG: SDR family oxidoreductase [Candidatus Lokiarchaeota archaeon]